MRHVPVALAVAWVAMAADSAQLARIAPRMQAFVDNGTAAGFVTLVTHKGRTVHHEAVGYLNLEAKTPASKDTIFEVMSMTKPVTAVGILMLAEEGLVGLNDAVEKHIPEFRGQWVGDGDRRVKAERPITIRDLLTHTSGLPEIPPAGMGGGGFYFRLDKPLGEAVTVYSQLPLLFQPGTRVQYSNPGMATLGRIIEVVSGKAYETFLDERVFRPLGMKDSFFFPAEAHRARISRVYDHRSGKLVDLGDAIYRRGAKYAFPEGGLYSTAADLAAFYGMMLRNGKPLLSRATVETMTLVHNAALQKGATAFGLGWNVVHGAAGTLPLSSSGTYGHAGAFATYGWVDPRREATGVFLVQYVGPEFDRLRNTFLEMANAALE